MQLVEQLRLKKADAQKLLFNRKRKLHELYSVTTCAGNHSKNHPHVDDLYFQQLQAFQDVNDLQKGRLFVESSLPPRRDIVRLTTTTSSRLSKQPNDTTTGQVKPSSTLQPAPSSPSRRGSAQPVNHPRSPRSNGPSRPTSAAPSDERPAHVGPANRLATPQSTIQPLNNASEDVAAVLQNAVHNANRKRDASLDASGQRSPKKQRTKSPVIPPPIETHDAQSSPASSHGRPASNTPAPEAGSPTTSPDDENVPTLDIMNTKPPEPHRDEPQTPEMAVAVHPIHKMSISSIDVDMIDVDPSTAFESPEQTTKHPPKSPHEQRPKKPSISVDTQNDQKSYFESRQNSGIVETPGPISMRQTPTTTPAVDSARRATRIQSGALQKKSVSEILGETPRSASPNDFPLSAAARASERERKEKERSRLSTVVFAKPARPHTDSETVEIAKVDALSDDPVKNEEKDYMYTLFESKANSQNRHGSLPYLLQHSHKTISTADHLVDYYYQAHCRVLKRLYQLQNLDKWSLRQKKRAEEPARQTSHWDFLLDHAKWMRTDFREERRWKIAAARAVAESCAEWVAASPAERKALQVQTRSPRPNSDVDVLKESNEQPISSPPGLEHHGEDDSVSEDLPDPRDIVSTITPAAIFSLGASEFTFATEKTPAFDKLMNELPLFQPARIEPDLSKSNLAEKFDGRWKTDIVPVSRYATEKLKVVDYKPPLKRSRYDYDVDDSPPSKRPALEPRETGVALFMPDNKHIRDRIHPGHAFRPPAEHPMPSQAFFETRMSSQWLASEDDEVRRQAREYSFNWTLISDLMTPPTLYQSGQDRRSAWECFERWIGLEGMPADMAKTPYFKTYSNRIETAQRNVQAQWEELERRNSATAPISVRKKTTLPVRVERKSNRRHLFMLDAMRKLAKKREAVRQKAMHSADMAAMRKTTDVHAPRPGMRTPAEWSQLKYERDQKMAKQQEMYKQQLIAHQRAVVQQQRGGPPVPNGLPVPVPPQAGTQIRIPGPNGTPMPGVPNGQLQAPNGQPRPHPNMMGMPQGMGMPAGMAGPKGLPQQMMGMGRGMAGSPQQIKMHQEQLMRQAQQGHANGAHSSPNVQQASVATGQANTNMAFMNTMNGTNGQQSPSTMGSLVSPRPGSSHVPQSLSSGSMPKITQLVASIKERNPTMGDDEVRNIATQQLVQWQQLQQQATTAAAGSTPRPRINQAALNAAMGAANSGASFAASSQNQNAMNMNSVNSAATMNQGMMTYEQAQQYHRRMQLQQAQQNAARGMPAPVGPNMTNSPVMSMARPVSQQSQSGISSGLNRNSATPAQEQRSGSVSTTAVNGAPQQAQVQTPAPPQTSVPGQQGSPATKPATPMQT